MTALVKRLRRSQPAGERLRLVVVETGCAVLSGAGASEFDETTAVMQMQGERPLAFAQRVLDRVARMGRPFQSATLLVGDGSGAESAAARRHIALGLLAHSANRDNTLELALETNPRAAAGSREELLGLAEELTTGSGQQPVSIKLRFGEVPAAEAPKSGVFWIAPTREPSAPESRR